MMNERIQNLKDKIWTEEYWTNPNTDKLLPAQLNKFAKLIVRECINEIAYIGKANEVFGDRTDKGGLNHILWTTETAIEKIKQHFGVEE